jgi:tRNA G10  N-methylase Trm11
MYGTEKIVNWLAHSKNSKNILEEAFVSLDKSSVRVIYLKANQTVQLPMDLRDKIEGKLKQAGIVMVKENPVHEFWIYLHEESKTAWLGVKISKHEDYHTSERMGILRPQIAYMMNFLSEPKSNERSIDPFAGSGELMSIRDKYFEGKEFVSIDVRKSGGIHKKETNRHKVIIEDFFKITGYENYFDSIVTDPPWGNLEKDINVSELYKQMADKFYKVLKDKGKAIVLVAERNCEVLEKDILGKFSIKSKFNFKVWGQPVTLYKMEKL